MCGDNIRPERTYLALSFDGTWPRAQPQDGAIWDHFVVDGPFREPRRCEPAPG